MRILSCLLGDPEIINFGNVLETPFSEIWNGEKIKMLKKESFPITAGIVIPRELFVSPLPVKQPHGRFTLSAALIALNLA